MNRMKYSNSRVKASIPFRNSQGPFRNNAAGVAGFSDSGRTDFPDSISEFRDLRIPEFWNIVIPGLSPRGQEIRNTRIPRVYAGFMRFRNL